jgi:AcrR family transcriptional regulator
MVSQLNILISKEFYIKDPLSSDLGKKILSDGLKLMFEIGLEDFTFKKLACKVGTTESTIYRYFESKNQFLFYLFNFYWTWMEYRLYLCVANIEKPLEKLERVIKMLTRSEDFELTTPFINASLLNQVISIEFSKTFLSKKVDEENKLGYFKQYKKFVEDLSQIVLTINPSYPYSHALISTVLESVFHQRYFTEHLPRLTDKISDDKNLDDFIFQLTSQAILNYSDAKN